MTMRRMLLFVTFELALARSGCGQDYTIQTIAGGGWDIPGVSANLGSLQGVAVDRAGNLFMALSAYSVVVRMDTTGQLSLVAGNGTLGSGGDGGPATLAQLNYPTAIALDTAGNVYIVDSGNNLIRMVSNAVISTVAGGGSAYPGDNGPATSARLGLSAGSGYAGGLAADAAGSIYFADTNGIRKVSNGVITTAAGGGFSYSDNIPATSAFVNAIGIAIDGAGRIYFADRCSSRIRRVSNGTITTVAGNGTANAFQCAQPIAGGNGNATSVSLNWPQGVAVDAAGTVYFTEGAISGNLSPSRARQVINGNITTVAGGNIAGPIGPAVADNVPATSVLLAQANSIAVDAAGNLYIADQYWLDDGRGDLTAATALGRLRKVSNGTISTIAGTNTDSGPAAGAQLNLPAGIAVDGAGSLYIADSSNNVIRRVSNAAIATVAGTRSSTYILTGPQGIAVDPAGALYVAQTGSLVKISGGAIATITDSSAPGIGFRGDGVALDAAGNLYFADWTGNRILMASNGVVSTITGNGTPGFSGDNGPAEGAQLSNPAGVALNGAGDIYFSDTGNQRIRKVSNGVITTVAGNGTAGFSGDNGPATSAQLNLAPVIFPPPPPGPFLGNLTFPAIPQLLSGIAVDASGSIYVVDSGNQRVRRISGGVITTIAGNGSPGYSGDGGPAVSAQFNNPSGLAVDAAGKVYVSDSSNGRIRVLVPPHTSVSAPTISLVANAFGESTTIAPNTWVEIKGANLAPPGDVRTWQGSDFLNSQLPTALDGVSVTMGGKSAYVYYISSNQINVLTPPDLPPLGPVQVLVTVTGVASQAFASQAQPISPSFFVLNGGPYVTAVHSNAMLIGPPSLYPGLTSPAKPGEAIVLYANGFGQTSQPVVRGSESQTGSLPALPLVEIGGVAATVQFAGLVSPGLYQFNVIVPASAPDGDNAVVATYNGVTTQSGTMLTIQH
jgi:uncharacterized protein (TIGR03437 family)